MRKVDLHIHTKASKSDVMFEFDIKALKDYVENCETREKKKMLLQLIISEITINEEREIDSIRLKINDNVIEYMSKQDGVSIKGASSIFVHKNMGVPMINLKIVI